MNSKQSIEDAAKEYADEIRAKWNLYTVQQFDSLVLEIWKKSTSQFTAQEQSGYSLEEILLIADTELEEIYNEFSHDYDMNIAKACFIKGFKFNTNLKPTAQEQNPHILSLKMLMDFALIYHNIKNKDIANDAAEFYYDNVLTTAQELKPVADDDEKEYKALCLAYEFHEIYERLAPSFGYETRKETREFHPNSDNGKLMIAVCKEILESYPHPKPVVNPVWVKASERLPGFDKQLGWEKKYIYRYEIIAEGTCCSIGDIIVAHGENHMIEYCLKSKADGNVEWLDESAIQPQPTDEALKALAWKSFVPKKNKQGEDYTLVPGQQHPNGWRKHLTSFIKGYKAALK